MNVVQVCAESNTEGSMFTEVSIFWIIRPNKTHYVWELKIKINNQKSFIFLLLSSAKTKQIFFAELSILPKFRIRY